MSEITTHYLYESSAHRSVTFCVFSQCGEYLGFVEDRRHVIIYKTRQILKFINHGQVNGVGRVVGEHRWRINGQPIDISPVLSIESTAGVGVNYIVFGDGDINNCRLPHRLAKRCSIVTKFPDKVCVIAVAKSNGYIDVYNLNLLKENYSPTLAKMVLVDGSQPIVHLSMSTNGALCLASTSCQGVVKLWDIWDDGNMYATLTSPMFQRSLVNVPFVDPSEQAAVPYNYEVSVTAWHPIEKHLFMGDQHGHGLVVEAERYYRRLHEIRHHHMISGAAYSRDGALLLTASFDGRCAVWAVPSYTCLHLYWHMDAKRSVRLLGGANDFHVTSLALAPDSETFATCCEDGKLRLWPLSPSLEPRVLCHVELDRSSLHRRLLVFSPCGQLLACSFGDSRLWLFAQPTRPMSLLSLCVSVIRQRVVKTVLAPPPPTRQSKPSPHVISALSSLPLPRELLSLLCYGLWPGCTQPPDL